jgi:FAD/FMN-containing dehydrogenase
MPPSRSMACSSRPELSPSNRATIGGMIATDASGQGSVLYGKTRDHVLELSAVFLDGTPWRSRPLTAAELGSRRGAATASGHVLRVLDRIREDDAGLIAERFPKLNRCVTGYDLVAPVRLPRPLRPQCGALRGRGDLAFVTEAKVRLTPVPGSRRC